MFLGLGLPWIIGSLYEAGRLDEDGNPVPGYFVPAGSLGFSVVIFLICAVICLIILVIRRVVVGGELGGTDKFGRGLSAFVLCTLWFIYIIMSALQAYEIGGLHTLSFGIDRSAQHHIPKCRR